MRTNIKLETVVFMAIVFISTIYPHHESKAQCFVENTVKAAQATGGTSPNKDKVVWLNWGGHGDSNSPYGKAGEELSVGATSKASLDLKGGKYLCIEAEIINIENVSGSDKDARSIQSYIPGTYVGDGVNSGDFLDILYNIGGGRTADNKSQNKMVSGIRNTNSKGGAKITIKCKASIGGIPIRLPGMVVADAESLAGSMNDKGDPSREYIYAEAHGTWHVVEVQQNLGQGPYNIRKENNPSGTQTIKFLGGNDKKTGAVAFLAFNDKAYNTKESNPDLSVSFTATLKGGGLTALALGLLKPAMDLGDAPASYGSPIHLLQNLTFDEDGIKVVDSSSDAKTKLANTKDINQSGYKAGNLKYVEGGYLGSTPPDADNGAMFSKTAMGDDESPEGSVVPNEEDAWPEKYKRFSYKQYYMPGNMIEAEIPYKGAKAGSRIVGWIDFDLNGRFDENELAEQKIGVNGDGVALLKWKVPSFRKPYSTYVRLRYFDVSEKDVRSPIDHVNFGEVEDHRMYILGPTITNPVIPQKVKR